MSVGFPASYRSEIDLRIDRSEAALLVAITLDSLGWKFEQSDPYTFEATTQPSVLSWGETVAISLRSPETLKIESRCWVFQLFDWGKNKRNVDSFLSLYVAKETTAARFRVLSPEKYEISGKTPLELALEFPESKET